MAKPGFKQTEIGEIPEEWEITSLGEISSKITDGTHVTPKYVPDGVPFISTKNIVPFKPGFDFQGYERYISKEEHAELSRRCKPERGDLLVSKCGTIGRTKLVDVDYEFSIFVGLGLIKLKNKAMGPFLEQLLNYTPYVKRMELASPGATRQTLTIGALEGLIIPLPPLPEQKKIASVLSTVDAAIEKTSEIIEQAKQVKKGLMQELLTRGIGHKKFKQTEIGEIPEEWEVVRLIDVVKFIRNGTTANQIANGDSNTKKVTRIETISEGIVDLSKTGRIKAFNGLEDFMLKRGDILLSHINSVQHIGKVALFDSDDELYHGMNLFLIRPNEAVEPHFLFYVLSSHRTKKYYEAICKKAVNQASLNKGEVGGLVLAKPPLPEQKKIAEILGAVDTKIEAEVQKLEQLQTLKKGLMQDLLTGRVRFPEFVKGVNS
jgi:type I restriction enzyme S subunit